MWGSRSAFCSSCLRRRVYRDIVYGSGLRVSEDPPPGGRLVANGTARARWQERTTSRSHRAYAPSTVRDVVLWSCANLKSLAHWNHSHSALHVRAPPGRSPSTGRSESMDNRSKVQGAWELGRGRFLRGPLVSERLSQSAASRLSGADALSVGYSRLTRAANLSLSVLCRLGIRMRPRPGQAGTSTRGHAGAGGGPGDSESSGGAHRVEAANLTRPLAGSFAQCTETRML